MLKIHVCVCMSVCGNNSITLSHCQCQVVIYSFAGVPNYESITTVSACRANIRWKVTREIPEWHESFYFWTDNTYNALNKQWSSQHCMGTQSSTLLLNCAAYFRLHSTKIMPFVLHMSSFFDTFTSHFHFHKMWSTTLGFPQVLNVKICNIENLREAWRWGYSNLLWERDH